MKIIYFDDQTREFSCILKVLGLPIFKEQVPLDEIQEFYAIFAPGGPDVIRTIEIKSNHLYLRIKGRSILFKIFPSSPA